MALTGFRGAALSFAPRGSGDRMEAAPLKMRGDASGISSELANFRKMLSLCTLCVLSVSLVKEGFGFFPQYGRVGSVCNNQNTTRETGLFVEKLKVMRPSAVSCMWRMCRRLAETAQSQLPRLEELHSPEHSCREPLWHQSCQLHGASPPQSPRNFS